MLEVEAEPKIVATTLELLGSVANQRADEKLRASRESYDVEERLNLLALEQKLPDIHRRLGWNYRMTDHVSRGKLSVEQRMTSPRGTRELRGLRSRRIVSRLLRVLSTQVAEVFDTQLQPDVVLAGQREEGIDLPGAGLVEHAASLVVEGEGAVAQPDTDEVAAVLFQRAEPAPVVVPPSAVGMDDVEPIGNVGRSVGKLEVAAVPRADADEGPLLGQRLEVPRAGDQQRGSQ